jgi:ribosomal subunit interface protein
MVEVKVRRRFAVLKRLKADITGCRVTIAHEHHRHRQGNPVQVRIALSVPGKGIVADHTHEDTYTAIRDAFDATRRQLEDYLRVRRGDVKRHA